MDHIVNKVRAMAAGCACGQHRDISIAPIVLERGALDSLSPFLREKGICSVTVVADAHTHGAAGAMVIGLLNKAGIHADLSIVEPNAVGDVIADEASVVQVMLDIPRAVTDVIIAVGSGTIHDIVRILSYKMDIPFISVPTAPSVDGFTSVGAPLILRGEKKTIGAVAPIALFGDLDILCEAPKALVAAGFGDMMGKFTSLFDWRFGALTAGEPYCEATAAITRDALNNCVAAVEEIAKRSEKGIRILMSSLIESGLAMLMFGQSHSASGAEHHLSHYWEMDVIKRGRRQLLHGAKVGVACTLIAELYQGARLSQTELYAELALIPTPVTLREWLRGIGAPTTPEELGIDAELLRNSLAEAHNVRLNRFTLLRAFNESNSSAQ